jgi:hypothetical protein
LRTLTVAAVTTVLALGGLSVRPVAASSGSPALGSGRCCALTSVSADSATDAWAVGSYINLTTFASETLALHWNGTSWSKVASPNPGGATAYNANNLYGVSADSPTDAWAVGNYVNPANSVHETLVLHWNGTRWSKVASPNPGGTGPASYDGNYLSGVSARSPTDAWAVGYYTPYASEKTLVLHWNGLKWSQVASPNFGGQYPADFLESVTADSATDAWAVGEYINSTNAYETLALHWDGKIWTSAASPNPGGASSGGWNFLHGVSARSPSDAWAVGDYGMHDSATQTLVVHWNGHNWSRVVSPSPGANATNDNWVSSVSADSATDAWAVGYYTNPTSKDVESLALHWNGIKWSQVASPNPETSPNWLFGVSSGSTTNAWAVGEGPGTIVLHWNGSSWSKA